MKSVLLLLLAYSYHDYLFLPKGDHCSWPSLADIYNNCRVVVSPDLLLLKMIILARVILAKLLRWLVAVCVSSTSFKISERSAIFFSKWFLSNIRSPASSRISALFCFFDPSEAKDWELILMVHSASKRSMKFWHSLIATSFFFLRADDLRTCAHCFILWQSFKAREGTSMSNRDSSLNPHGFFTAATSSLNRAVSMMMSKLAASFPFRNVWRSLANWRILWETIYAFCLLLWSQWGEGPRTNFDGPLYLRGPWNSGILLSLPHLFFLRADDLRTCRHCFMLCPRCKASEATSMSNRDSSLNPHRSFTAATSSSNHAVSMKSLKLAASFSFRNVWRNLANWRILWET